MNLPIILDWLRSIAPEETAYAGDPVGLLVNIAETDVSHVAVTLDATPDAVNTAIELGAQLLVCHHPLIYAPLKRITMDDPIANSVAALVRANIALYAMHTNWDRAVGGVNDTLAGILELHEVEPLAESGDVQIARIGNVAEPTTVGAFALFVSRALDTTYESALRYNPKLHDKPVSRVAVCGGAGAGLLQHAIAAGADVFVTSDVRHHEFVDAASRGAAIFDAGHGATERPGMAALAQRLRSQFGESLNVAFIE